MSRIGRKQIDIKEGVTVDIGSMSVVVNGPLGQLSFNIPKGIEVKNVDGKITVVLKDRAEEDSDAKFGLTRAMIANMIKGVSSGFEKKLELSGVGYRGIVSGDELSLSVGFSHPVKLKAPEGVKFSVSENIITVSGKDKTLVGNTAAKIRAIRPPEPYKGKGIRYLGEKIRRKAGKAAKVVGGAK